MGSLDRIGATELRDDIAQQKEAEDDVREPKWLDDTAEWCGEGTPSPCNDVMRLKAHARELREALHGAIAKLPNERTTYCGTGRCAGCGALHWCSGNPGPKEPCKDDCVLKTAVALLNRQEPPEVE